MVCRVSHFYAMGYREVIEMPIRSFWVFSRNIDRIEAQERIGALEVANHAQSGEGATQLNERLVLVLGEVVEPDVMVEGLDRAGLDELRGMV